MSAVTQPRWQDGREVVRCECGLIQFKSTLGKCVKSICRKPYVDFVIDPPIEPEPEEPKVPVGPIVVNNPNFPIMSIMLKLLRLAHGWSQPQMAKCLGVNRTYISKIENNKATPTVSTLERICYTLGISMEGFFYLCEQAA